MPQPPEKSHPTRARYRGAHQIGGTHADTQSNMRWRGKERAAERSLDSGPQKLVTMSPISISCNHRSGPELDQLMNALHDRWFNVDAIVFELSARRVTVPIADRNGGVPHGVMIALDVESLRIRDDARVGWVDISEVSVSADGHSLYVASAFPVVLTMTLGSDWTLSLEVGGEGDTVARVVAVCEAALAGRIGLKEFLRSWPADAKASRFLNRVYVDLEDGIEHTPGTWLSKEIDFELWTRSEQYFVIRIDLILLEEAPELVDSPVLLDCRQEALGLFGTQLSASALGRASALELAIRAMLKRRLRQTLVE